MEREKETHTTGISRVRVLAVSGPARPTKERLQTPVPAADTWPRDATPPPPSCAAGDPAAPAGRLPRVTHGSRICTDRLCDNSRGGEALHARSPPAAAGSFQPRGR